LYLYPSPRPHRETPCGHSGCGSAAWSSSSWRRSWYECPRPRTEEHARLAAGVHLQRPPVFLVATTIAAPTLATRLLHSPETRFGGETSPELDVSLQSPAQVVRDVLCSYLPTARSARPALRINRAEPLKHQEAPGDEALVPLDYAVWQRDQLRPDQALVVAEMCQRLGCCYPPQIDGPRRAHHGQSHGHPRRPTPREYNGRTVNSALATAKRCHHGRRGLRRYDDQNQHYDYRHALERGPPSVRQSLERLAPRQHCRHGGEPLRRGPEDRHSSPRRQQSGPASLVFSVATRLRRRASGGEARTTARADGCRMPRRGTLGPCTATRRPARP